MDLPDSPIVEKLPEDLDREYRRFLAQSRAELKTVLGLETLHAMLIERLCLVYALMRHHERDFPNLDLQRYNQLLASWLKIGEKLLDKYKEIYAAGALEDVFVAKVMTAVAEEVGDNEVLEKIRERMKREREADVAR